MPKLILEVAAWAGALCYQGTKYPSARGGTGERAPGAVSPSRCLTLLPQDVLQPPPPPPKLCPFSFQGYLSLLP